MTKYRKRQIVVDAEQVGEPTPVVTIEGATIVVQPGDWVITGIRGEKYPCKDDLFRLTYDPAPTDGAEIAKSWDLDSGLVGSALNAVLGAIRKIEFEPVADDLRGAMRMKVTIRTAGFEPAVEALGALFQRAKKADACPDCEGWGYRPINNAMERCQSCNGSGDRHPRERVGL